MRASAVRRPARETLSSRVSCAKLWPLATPPLFSQSARGRILPRLLAASLAACACSPPGASAWAGKHEEPAAPVCKEAIVNPVSGAPECVNPPGAPVAPAPPRPPPTREECLRYANLHLEACRRFESPHPDHAAPAR